MTQYGPGLETFMIFSISVLQKNKYPLSVSVSDLVPVIRSNFFFQNVKKTKTNLIQTLSKMIKSNFSKFIELKYLVILLFCFKIIKIFFFLKIGLSRVVKSKS